MKKTASVQKTEAVFCVRQIYHWSKEIDRTGVKDALDAPCAQRSGIILAVFTSSG